MPQIFLAHANEDKPLVRELYGKLVEAGYKPWFDEEDLLPGQNWREEIPKALKNSDMFIACLSSTSISKRGYIQKEFKMAMEMMAEFPSGTIYFIPLKFDDCEIPELRQSEYGLNLKDLHWLDYWNPNGFEKLIKSIEHQFGSQETDIQESQDNVAGNKTINNNYYVERPPLEINCFQEIEQDGALLRIKAPQKMGKTLLLKQIFDSNQAKGFQKVRLDLQLLESSILTDSSQFLRWLCQRVSRKLKLENCLDDYWGEMTPNTACTHYFEEYILETIETPLLLGIDNIDRLFAPEFTTIAADFFGLLRAWWGYGQTIGGNWKKLRLIVIYSTEDLPQLNVYQSPFNVGTEVKIPEFNDEQIRELAQRYEFNWSSSQIQQLTKQLGGHPYLVHEAIKYLKQYPDLTLSDLLNKSATDEGIYATHWQNLWSTLEKDKDLATQLRIIVSSKEKVAISPTYLYKLDSMGLIKRVGNQVEPRCPLYRQYFRERLSSLENEG
ncbi:AAA-like domain-containing protein [Crocosphaera sp. Alani8]|uniref:AAA-like domain-containing protein n=1 Tax=Crocosphaera sp. Alani8 TaxID=3038952 RepID=UPI00313CAEAF